MSPMCKRRKIARDDGAMAPGSSAICAECSRASQHKTDVALPLLAPDETACWFCGVRNPFCYNVLYPTSPWDPDMDGMVGLGVLPITFPESGNTISMCRSCHLNFECKFPAIYAIPTDLGYFISFEHADYKKRSNEFFSTGKWQPRTVPTADEYRQHQVDKGEIGRGNRQQGGLYQRIARTPFLNQQVVDQGVAYEFSAPGKIGPPKQWHGCPTALIYHAFNLLQWYSDSWMDRTVAEQLHELKRLYNREDPWELLWSQGSSSHVTDMDDEKKTIKLESDATEMEDEMKSVKLESLTEMDDEMKSVKPESHATETDDEKETPKLERQVTESEDEKKTLNLENLALRQPHDPRWKWGPNSTTAMKMERYTVDRNFSTRPATISAFSSHASALHYRNPAMHYRWAF
ncbi:hypothetical protein ABW21_db0206557 [Orbilia brochopaga]|nr:hypothetical protein ABW21_db0206557 [Drechslerella brochopaga]